MNRTIISINAGSSTLKFQVYLMPAEQVIAKGMIDKIGKSDAEFKLSFDDTKLKLQEIELNTPQQCVDYILYQLEQNQIIQSSTDIEGVGHRVAHGGEFFTKSVIVDDEVINNLEQLCDLAPLHNPINVAFIKAMKVRLPNSKHVAIFDTSFHQSIDKKHFLYALPYQYYQEDHIRRYGFHGTSHQYVSQVCAQKLKRPVSELKIISCHLGSGASICAIDKGKSVNTSMGFTPLAGLMMGTRCGDIDPSILIYLTNKHKLTSDQLNSILINDSGLLGISGVSNDCREVEEAAKNGNPKAQIALDMFIARIRDFIGSYMVQMGGVDTILFTGGIGENSATIRRGICENLTFFGIKLDDTKNQDSKQTFIHSDESKISIAIINTNEELMMARKTENEITRLS